MNDGRQMPGRDRRWLILLVALLGLGLLTVGLAHPMRLRGPVDSAIWTPVTLRRALNRAPVVWIRRTLWVRACAVPVFAWTCQHDDSCVVRWPSLADPTVDPGDAVLPLLFPPDLPLWTLLRQVPVIGGLLFRAPAIPWGAITLNQSQVRLPPSCSAVSCAAALLVGDPIAVPLARPRTA